MSDLDHGPQPLGTLMDKWGLENHDLVEASPEQLTHKQVQRARQGRRLTLKMMMKVNRAYNIAIWNRLDKEQKEQFVEYGHKELFSYAKGYEEGWRDPNLALREEVGGEAGGGEGTREEINTSSAITIPENGSPEPPCNPT